MTRGIQGRSGGSAASSQYVLILGALKHVTACEYRLSDFLSVPRCQRALTMLRMQTV